MNKALKSFFEYRFGIEDLLHAKARVIYENLFDTKHIGRVIDFFLYESEKFFVGIEMPELFNIKVRNLIELGVVCAWTNYRKADKIKCVEIEMGWDDRRMIVSVSMPVDKDIGGFVPPDIIAVQARATEQDEFIEIKDNPKSPQTPTSERILKMLQIIKSSSDGLLIRHDTRSHRLQFVSILSKDGSEKFDKIELCKVIPIKTVKKPTETETETETETVSNPEALHATHFDEFSGSEKEDEKQRRIGFHNSALPADVRERLQKRESGLSTADIESGDDAFVIKGGAIADQDTTVKTIKNNLPNNDDKHLDQTKLKVADKPSKSDDDLHRLKNGDLQDKQGYKMGPDGLSSDSDKQRSIGDLSSKDRTADQWGRSKGSTEPLLQSKPSVPSSAKLSAEEKEAELETKEVVDEKVEVLSKVIEGHADEILGSASKDQVQELVSRVTKSLHESYAQTIEHLKKTHEIQLESKMKLHQDQIQGLNARVGALLEQLEDKKPQSRKPMEPKSEQVQNIEKAQSKIETLQDYEKIVVKASAQETNFENKLKKFARELDQPDVPESMKTWAKGFMEEIVKDRASLNDRIQEVDLYLKKKELAFSRVEASLNEKGRLKDELVKQKDYIVKQTKDALAQSLVTIEKLKSSVSQQVDKAEMERKVAGYEKLLNLAKENSEKLTRRADELSNKIKNEAQLRANLEKELSDRRREIEDLKKTEDRTKALSSALLEAKQDKQQLDANKRIIETQKRQIKELQDKIAQKLQSTGAQAVPAAATLTATKKTEGPSAAELNHKLDQSNRLLKTTKDEFDKLKKKFDEQKKIETELKLEIGKLQASLKAASKPQKQ